MEPFRAILREFITDPIAAALASFIKKPQLAPPAPPPVDLPSVEDLVITAASYEPPPITLDEAFEELDAYRRASLFAHKGPEKPNEAPKPPKATPAKLPGPAKAPETPSPTIKKSFGRGH